MAGLFWQNGARPFTTDPDNFKVNLTDPKIKQVTEFWDKLYAAGAISHDADFTDAWYQGFARGKYAGWLSAAWGPIFLQDYTKNSKGKWRAQALPQWEEGENVSGNWGGSTLAVLKVRASAGGGDRIRALDPLRAGACRDVLVRAVPVPAAELHAQNQQWLNRKYAFYGGQQVNKVYADMADAVDTGWEWPPILEYVATEGDAIKGKSVEQGKGVTAALQPWQDAVVRSTPSSRV